MSNSSAAVARRLGVLERHLQDSPGAGSSFLNSNDVCGIIAFVGQEPAVPILIEGLKVLESRGYDSAGIATINPVTKEMVTSKFASAGKTNNAITLLEQHLGKHDAHVAGIAHTRWATHGARTDENAHPHLDQAGRIAVVHNGVIENSNELKKELQSQHGIHFRSETDTEVIAQLVRSSLCAAFSYETNNSLPHSSFFLIIYPLCLFSPFPDRCLREAGHVSAGSRQEGAGPP
jgi:glucosamine--fructose-6-phosphate aminotransferase (isomerizing)